jgi:hypothetical protein
MRITSGVVRRTTIVYTTQSLVVALRTYVLCEHIAVAMIVDMCVYYIYCDSQCICMLQLMPS